MLGGPLRSYYLAKALVDRGHEVVVITARKQSAHTVETIEGIEVHYLPVPYNNRFGFYKRGGAFVGYALRALLLAGKIKNVSLCYAISVPLTVGLTAIWIKRRYGIPFIFEVGDLWPDAPVQLGFVQNKLLKQSLYWLEKRIYQHAKSIVALSPSIQATIEKKMPAKKVWLIPNMADTFFYKPEPKKPSLEQQFHVQDKFVVSYIGAVGYANGLDYYLECARASQKARLPVHFILCGDGAMLDHLQAAAKQLKLENLSFIAFQNRRGVQEIMNITDAVFISYRPFPILETGSPNKYFDGLAAGKLIILNFGGWIRNEVENEKCGMALDPKYPHSFVNQIQPFLSDKNMLEHYGFNAGQLAERKYSRARLGEQFVSIIVEE